MMNLTQRETFNTVAPPLYKKMDLYYRVLVAEYHFFPLKWHKLEL